MNPTTLGTGFSSLDYVAVVFFFASWVMHFWIINHSSLREKTITYRMAMHRQHWMHNMVHRDPKMADALIQNTLQYGVLFFASTTILLIGALMAGLGASEKAIALLSDLPFVVEPSRTAWEIKVLMVIFIFTFAFFKFAWSYRLFNYVLVLMGAAPDISAKASMQHCDDQSRMHIYEQKYLDNYAKCVGKLHALGARHFTTGLNSYFFALAAVAWFLDARLFILATIWVSIVLYRRAFRSNFLKILTDIE
ncbi:MAG: DUF599 family protein [Pseudomonadota bacterium]